jgi:hypothetical protein
MVFKLETKLAQARRQAALDFVINFLGVFTALREGK